MGIVLILLCTLIGLILGSAWAGFIAGLVIVLLPLVLDEMDNRSAARRRRDRMRRR